MYEDISTSSSAGSAGYRNQPAIYAGTPSKEERFVVMHDGFY